MKLLAGILSVLLLVTSASAGSVTPRDGWAVHDTGLGYEPLIDSLKKAVKANGMFVVTQAGPTGAARKRGIEIPGNRVLGIYNNKFAVRAIRLSVPAMIEAPIRFYVTEGDDGTATLSYKTPSHVFSPYFAEADPDLKTMASELDEIFAKIAADAIGN